MKDSQCPTSDVYLWDILNHVIMHSHPPNNVKYPFENLVWYWTWQVMLKICSSCPQRNTKKNGRPIPQHLFVILSGVNCKLICAKPLLGLQSFTLPAVGPSDCTTRMLQKGSEFWSLFGQVFLKALHNPVTGPDRRTTTYKLTRGSKVINIFSNHVSVRNLIFISIYLFICIYIYRDVCVYVYLYVYLK